MTSGKETKEPINKENQNYWLELADGSIMYIKKDGSFARYENNYKIEYGSLEENSCILSNLNYYSKKGNYNLKSYHPTYFNNKQDCEIELDFFKKITDYREEKGYLKYMGENNREYFVDITTQKKYYASNDTLKAKDYSLYTVKGIPNVSSSSQIIKNKDGKTVYINRGKPIVKYFDDTNTAIAGDLFRDNEYRNVKLLSMDDIANPVFIKGGKFIRLTSNKNVLIITYKNEKKQLINSEGKTITKCYDVISETKYNDSVYKFSVSDRGDSYSTKDILYVDDKIVFNEFATEANSYSIEPTRVKNIYEFRNYDTQKSALINSNGEFISNFCDCIIFTIDKKFNYNKATFDNIGDYENSTFCYFNDDGEIINENELVSKEKSKSLVLQY